MALAASLVLSGVAGCALLRPGVRGQGPQAQVAQVLELKCPRCGQRLRGLSALERECPHCGLHIRYSNGGSPDYQPRPELAAKPRYRCPWCGKIEPTVVKLRVHVRKSHYDVSYCPFCDEDFGSRTGLSCHAVYYGNFNMDPEHLALAYLLTNSWSHRWLYRAHAREVFRHDGGER